MCKKSPFPFKADFKNGCRYPNKWSTQWKNYLEIFHLPGFATFHFHHALAVGGLVRFKNDHEHSFAGFFWRKSLLRWFVMKWQGH